MGILQNIRLSRLGLKGTTPSVLAQSLPSSTLHSTTSLNGVPTDKSISVPPSRLDLNAETPVKYLDNPPT